jgi:hypothetical protein
VSRFYWPRNPETLVKPSFSFGQAVDIAGLFVDGPWSFRYAGGTFPSSTQAIVTARAANRREWPITDVAKVRRTWLLSPQHCQNLIRRLHVREDPAHRFQLALMCLLGTSKNRTLPLRYLTRARY